MKQTVKDRIIEFIQWRGLSRRAFSRMIGMPETFISSMKNGTSDENLNKIIEQFPELNKAWLLIGEGDMLKKSCKLSLLMRHRRPIIGLCPSSISIALADFIQKTSPPHLNNTL